MTYPLYLVMGTSDGVPLSLEGICPSPENDPWISLVVVDFDIRQAYTLLCVRWEPQSLLSWLRENRDAILSQPCPAPATGNQSIAESIVAFYSKIDPDSDEDEYEDAEMDEMYDYRDAHCLKFGMPGTDMVPHIYLGKQGDGHYISLCQDGESWNYRIDIDAFYADVERFYWLLEGYE